MNDDESQLLNGNILPQLGSGSSVLYLEPVAPKSTRAPQKTLVEHIHLVLSRKILLMVCLLAGAVVAIAITLSEPQVYQAQATIEVRTLRTGASLIAPGSAEVEPADVGWLETQIRILESDALAERVRAKLQREHPGRVYQMQDVFADWRQKLRLPRKKVGERTTKIPPVKTKVINLGASSILQITCESWDPQLTAEYADGLASEYIQYTLENLGDSMTRISEWLTNQVRDARDQLEQSEDQLQNYTREANLVYTGDEQQESSEHKKLRELQQDLARATADRMVKQAAYETAKSNSAETMPNVRNERLSTYLTTLVDLQHKLDDLRRVYTDSHYKVKTVLAQIQELEASIRQERADILQRSRNEYDQALHIEQMLSNAYAAQLPEASETARKGIRYGLMKWDVETNRRVYEALLQRIKAINIGSTLQANNSSILDHAKAPQKPHLPNVTRNTLSGAASGLAIGLLIIFAGEFINRSFKAPGEAVFHLGVPELGVIPELDKRVTTMALTKLPRMVSLSIAPDDSQLERITWEDRPSLMAEAYRSTLASILLSTTGKSPHQVILITSPGRGEGKSSTVSNLGIALAEINQKVILIDADLRKPTLHTIFRIPNSWGLSDILRENTPLGESPIEALARPTSIAGLHLLPSGPGTNSIANLFYSDRLPELVNRLRREFDVIIIDTPPISYLSDARFIGRVVDKAVLVLRAGLTTREAAISASLRLKEDGIQLLGTILNAWDGRAKSRYGYGDGYAYPYQAPSNPLV